VGGIAFRVQSQSLSQMSTILVCSDTRHSKNDKVDNPRKSKSTYLAISGRVACLNQNDRLVSCYGWICDYGIQWNS
jgi:hypothetical protein